ncbi:MAG: miniconductance mechanosensitive channel, partial [Psychromonas sp.]
MKEIIIDWIKTFYLHEINGNTVFDQSKYDSEGIWWTLGMSLVLLALFFAMWVLSRTIMVKLTHTLVDKSKTTWDDHLMKNKVFRSLAHLVPLMFLEYFLSICFYRYPTLSSNWTNAIIILIIVVVLISVRRLLNAANDIIIELERFKGKPIHSYIQVGKIIASTVMLILILSIVTNKTPIFFLTSLGAMAAILVLIFKDTILGFIGSIQLSTNDMIRIGDWVTVEKYGADGDVFAVTLSTVKIRNFDKTITTIPTYAFISDSFKNWRGMEESDGRRIKRSLKIHIDSIKFASDELIESLKQISIFKEFVITRQKEIEEYNDDKGFIGENEISGRKMTNIGLFRRYIEYYLKHNPNVNQEMTM